MMITFYDIQFTVPGRALSPYTWIAKHCLKFKGLEFNTKWVDLVDITPLCKMIGAEPTILTTDGREIYTLPVIHDPSTGKTVSDSFKIAQYLDEAYPETSRIVPPGTTSLHRAFMSAVHKLEADMYPLIIATTFAHVPESSREYFRRTREAFLKKPLEEISRTTDEAKETWEKVKAAFAVFDSWYEKDAVFIGGKEPCFADLMLAGRVFWIRSVFGEESIEWKNAEGWNHGRWSKLLRVFEEK
ncbi:hypothetical protein NLJ89_g4714 [Agrocybe chaxingu]|uniref:GST N-terminal domain-containing protein n=1 Tax=Agrocybe chaxingu TaxID=84603 RepID=A0A9W8K8D8_9AGAR|nr:hypothetical protein NLJ89_g4714 [Agrocybe chaxingu]